MNWLRRKKPVDRHVVAPGRATTMAPQRDEVPQIFRTYSESGRGMADPPAYEQVPRYGNDGQLYEESGEGLFDMDNFNAVTTTTTGPGQVTEASEETLVEVRGAMVYLVDDEESPLLAEGRFSVVRIEQEGNGIVAFVRVGERLRWPLTKDEPAVKLDSTHYFFTIRVPRAVDEMDRETAGGKGGETLSYGVTFSVAGQEQQLRELDSLLEQYSDFSVPQLVRGDRQEVVVPEAVVSSEGMQVGLVPFLVLNWRERDGSFDDLAHRFFFWPVDVCR